MIPHTEITDKELKSLIRQRIILFGGNARLKIYGLLNCRSGKRMKKENRVFFSSADEAIENRYRPCGHCMPAEYRKWKTT
ncbi:MAG: metal-binding protein [Bacteroidetes bacterium]|nr:metal-binding protein [Bacteroidota bacterium]